jgi:hypothetical protein
LPHPGEIAASALWIFVFLPSCFWAIGKQDVRAVLNWHRDD